MKLVKVAAGLFAAGLMASAHAVTVLSEGFANVGALASAGWVFTNSSSSPGLSWFQGNSGVFAAQAGGADSYAAVSFNSTTAVDGAVDNWLISPELALGAGATMSFFTRASDAGFFDRLEVRFSSGSGTATSGFTALVTTVGSSVSATYPTSGWTAFTLSLPTAATGRIAFHYSLANAMDASYIGIDSLTVSAVPEPASLALFGLGSSTLAAFGAFGALRRRRAIGAPLPAKELST